MSLDIYFNGPKKTTKCYCHSCGNEHTSEEAETYFQTNITHNLGRMAERAGIYQILWRPEEIGVIKADELESPLEDAINKMIADPETFKAFDATNGWGTYEQFVPWLKDLLSAVKTYPYAEIKVSR